MVVVIVTLKLELHPELTLNVTLDGAWLNISPVFATAARKKRKLERLEM